MLIYIIVNIFPLYGKIIEVPGDSSSVQAGINGTVNGDTVMISPGIFNEHSLDFLGKLITVMSTDPHDSSIVANTVIDADYEGRVFYFHSREDSNSILNGLTLRHGSSDYGGGIYFKSSSPVIMNCMIFESLAEFGGGGIFCDQSTHPSLVNCSITQNNTLNGDGGGAYIWKANPLLKKCKIEGNWCSDGDGGGVFCLLASPTFEDCTVARDSAWIGGGIRIYSSSPTFKNCVITSNKAYVSYGGGVDCRESSPLFINCSITDNVSAIARGGGLYFADESMPTVISCVIEGNSAGSTGGGISTFYSFLTMRNCLIRNNWAGSGGAIELKHYSHTIANCTITSNIATSVGGGFYLEDAAPFIVNTILWNDEPEEIFINSGDNIEITYSDIQGGWEGEGNMDIEPLFRNPTINDYYLMSIECGDPYNSPCVDAGYPDSIDILLDCTHGLGTMRSDMGAFGGNNAEEPTGIRGDAERIIVIPRKISLDQNYPNPFNPMTTITFEIPNKKGAKQNISLNVYDIRGKRVKTLIRGAYEAGKHKVLWDGRNELGEKVSSGIYLYTMRNGEVVITKKMIILE
jgi:hypothetical protein